MARFVLAGRLVWAEGHAADKAADGMVDTVVDTVAVAGGGRGMESADVAGHAEVAATGS